MRTPIAIINKNPLNIRFSPMNQWKGQIGDRKGFCEFAQFYYGCRAAMVLLSNYVRKGYATVPEIIARWAPASENNTKVYIAAVVGRLAHRWYDAFDAAAVDAVRSKLLTSHDLLADLAYEMAHVEIGYNYLSNHPADDDSLFQMFHQVATEEKLPSLMPL